MVAETTFYTNLVKDLQRFGKLLTRVPKLQAHSDVDNLKVHAYFLMCHAAFEVYLEEVSRWVSQEAVRIVKAEGRFCRAAVALVANEAVLQAQGQGRRKLREDACRDPEAFLSAATSNHHISIGSNHGVKREDQENLLLPIGLRPDEIDVATCASLDAFGADRGDLAHRTAITTVHTRNSVQARCATILLGIKNYDQAAVQQLK